MSLLGDFVSSLYLALYTSKKWSVTIIKCDETKSKSVKRRCGRIDMRELIDEKVDDDCTFVWKNKTRAKTRVQFWSRFIILP